jgi:hypothetical protein
VRMMVDSGGDSNDVDCIHRYVCCLCGRLPSAQGLSAYRKPRSPEEIHTTFLTHGNHIIDKIRRVHRCESGYHARSGKHGLIFQAQWRREQRDKCGPPSLWSKANEAPRRDFRPDTSTLVSITTRRGFMPRVYQESLRSGRRNVQL